MPDSDVQNSLWVTLSSDKNLFTVYSRTEKITQ